MKAIILLLILLPAHALGEIAVDIGGNVSYGVDSGDIYFTPGHGVSVPLFQEKSIH